MEPITTTAIATLLSYWGSKAFEKVFDTTAGEFTKDSIKWLKSVFFKEDEPKEVLEQWQEKPDSTARQNAAKAAIEVELEENPQAKKWLMEITEAIKAKLDGGITISNSKNVVSDSTIHSGRDTIVGDNNRS
jgi:hypothetical protein